jgi:radical SAM superfamily enzyme YgiQ (UPF0313 family)
MSKILLLQQFLGDNNEVGPIFPIGLAYLATAIRETDWEVRVLDMNVSERPYDELKDTLLTYSPDVVGISLRNIDNVDLDAFNYFYFEFIRLIDYVSHFPVKILVGGTGFSIFSNIIFSRHSEIDFGIIQEGEETIVELLNHISKQLPLYEIKGLYFRNDEEIVFTGKRSPARFSSSHIPDRSLFNVEKYLQPLCLGVLTKRGCSLNCSYCPYPFLAKNTERFRQPKDVVDEIEELVTKYGAPEIVFCDDIFNYPQNHATAILHEMIKRGVNIRWSAWFDVGSTDEEFMRLAVKSGCYRFCFSVEALTPNTLTHLRKNFTVQQIRKLLRICKKKEFSKVIFRFSLFAMPPGQTCWGMIKTVMFVFHTHLLMHNSKCLVSWIRILPNTGICQMTGFDESDLLPMELSAERKKSLFYRNESIPKLLESFYKIVLDSIGNLRSFLKRKIIKRYYL